MPQHQVFKIQYRLKSSDSTVKPSERLIVAGDRYIARKVFKRLPIGKKSLVISVSE